MPWPIAPGEAILSDKDKLLPRLSEAGRVAGAAMTGTILIVGETGQLAVALAEAIPAHGLTAQRAGRPALDFDRPDSIATSVPLQRRHHWW